MGSAANRRAEAAPLDARIDALEVSAFTVPTDAPEEDGTYAWDSTTLVVVEALSGEVRGTGYTYADTATARLIQDKLRKQIEGRRAVDVAGAWEAMRHAIRNLGRPGICSMAISAVDAALWDLKGHLLGQSVLTLLGAVRDAIPVYGSGGFTSYSKEQLQRQLGAWAEQGIRMVKMKIGARPEQDPERVRQAREAIGPHVELFVDANGAFARKQALRMADTLQRFDVRWFEEPVSSDDLEGLRLMRDRAPACMDIAAGEYGYDLPYFARMLDAEAVDTLQADGTRCGGITELIRVAALCSARNIRLSAHTAPTLHAHVMCAVAPAVHVEYFHDHARIEQLLFDGALRARSGALHPDRSRPGLGIALRRKDAEPFAVPF